MTDISKRREFLKLGLGGAALAGAVGVTALSTQRAAAQSADGSLLQTVLNRGHLIVGTGSTNAPWHFENDAGELVGMDITMGKILAKALFDDENAIEFVKQDAAQRIPNITTGRVDVSIQFMTISGARAQVVAFSRPYYVEGIALLTHPDAELKTFDQLLENGGSTRISILQNVDAETNVRRVLPEAQVMQIDTQANVIQALEARRVDGAAVDLSTVRWLVARNPDRYLDSGMSWMSMLYGAALRQGDPDWQQFVDTAFAIGIHGHDTALYDTAFEEYFGAAPPNRVPGFPSI